MGSNTAYKLMRRVPFHAAPVAKPAVPMEPAELVTPMTILTHELEWLNLPEDSPRKSEQSYFIIPKKYTKFSWVYKNLVTAIQGALKKRPRNPNEAEFSTIFWNDPGQISEK